MTLVFDEDYFNGQCSINPEKFFVRAEWIRDSLEVTKGVIVIGGGVGFLTKYLNGFGIKSINYDTSQWCYDNKATEFFEQDPTKIKYKDYDWIVSWSVLDCLDDFIVDYVCGLLNAFDGQQLHVFSCDDNDNSKTYISDGYFIKPHKYWKKKLPQANLVCWDCKKTIQGEYNKVPLMQDWVAD